MKQNVKERILIIHKKHPQRKAIMNALEWSKKEAQLSKQWRIADFAEFKAYYKEKFGKDIILKEEKKIEKKNID